MENVQTLLSHMEIELSADHISVIPGLLWSMSCMGMLEGNKKLVTKGLDIV